MTGATPEAVLRWALESFPRIAIVASFQAESSVLIDMAAGIRPDSRVLTLDTGRLPQETYDLIDRVRERYAIEVQVVSPDAGELAEMVGTNGVNLFYQSGDMRRLCCDVRKSRPLARALQGYDAWVTGVRRQQATTRSQTPVVAADPEHGYTSIGCAPCTRATAAGEDERAGRWWWEQGEVKECGLHWAAT
jgi:phosphoadenosine phosphosulfate reductase